MSVHVAIDRARTSVHSRARGFAWFRVAFARGRQRRSSRDDATALRSTARTRESVEWKREMERDERANDARAFVARARRERARDLWPVTIDGGVDADVGALKRALFAAMCDERRGEGGGEEGGGAPASARAIRAIRDGKILAPDDAKLASFGFKLGCDNVVLVVVDAEERERESNASARVTGGVGKASAARDADRDEPTCCRIS